MNEVMIKNNKRKNIFIIAVYVIAIMFYILYIIPYLEGWFKPWFSNIETFYFFMRYVSGNAILGIIVLLPLFSMIFSKKVKQQVILLIILILTSCLYFPFSSELVWGNAFWFFVGDISDISRTLLAVFSFVLVIISCIVCLKFLSKSKMELLDVLVKCQNILLIIINIFICITILFFDGRLYPYLMTANYYIPMLVIPAIAQYLTINIIIRNIISSRESAVDQFVISKRTAIFRNICYIICGIILLLYLVLFIWDLISPFPI